MKTEIEILRKTRDNFMRFLDFYDNEQLMEIPSGYKNNILWNIGHALVTHDLLVHGRSGLAFRLPEEVIERYRKGTSPSDDMVNDLDLIRKEIVEGVDALEKIIESGNLPNYDPYTTSYGYEINSFSEAVQFNNVHEALHLGYAMALKNTLSNKD